MAIMLGAIAMPQSSSAGSYMQLSNTLTSLEGESIYRFNLSEENSKGDDGNTKTKTETTELSTLLTGRALTQGYIWKPWFSRLKLEGLGTFRHSSVGSEFSGNENTREGLGLDGIGRMDLTLYPGSRFPFNANLAHHETFSDDDGVEERRYDTSLQLDQQYRSLEREGIKGSANYRHRDAVDDDGSYSINELRTNLSQQFETQEYNASFEWLRNENRFDDSNEGDSSGESLALFGDHDIRFDESHLSVSSFASFVDSESIGNDQRLSADIWQAVNNISWYPGIDEKLELRSDSRLTSFDSRSRNGNTVEARDTLIMANLMSADYEVTEKFDIDASINSVYQDFEGSPETLFTESVGVTYEEDEVPWGEWSYQWLASSRAGLGQGDGAPNSSLDNSFRQSLSQQYNGRGVSSLQFAQGVTLHALNRDDVPLTLTHSVDYSWRQSEENVSDYIFINFIDDRDVGGDIFERQQFDWQAQRDQRFYAGGELELDLFGQFFREKNAEGTTVAASINGGLGFDKPNIIGVARLNYLLNLDVSLEKVFESPEEEDPSPRVTLTNRLLWNYGRLSATAQMQYTITEESSFAGVFFELKRRWAAY